MEDRPICFSVYSVQNLTEIEAKFGAKPLTAAFEAYASRSQADPKKFKPMADNLQIFPNYWAPIIVSHNNNRIALPMRYRLRPSGSTQELPAKYNMFNARLDSLTRSSIWSKIFMKNHGLLIFKHFYEWVIDKKTKKKKLICFKPKEQNLMWSPVLFDYIKDENGSTLFSFTLITHEPPLEVLEAGHDRCPIFLREEHIDNWLRPHHKTVREIENILLDKPEVVYEASDLNPE